MFEVTPTKVRITRTVEGLEAGTTAWVIATDGHSTSQVVRGDGTSDVFRIPVAALEEV